VSEIGPNAPCPCGSGLKAKRCCGDPRRTAAEDPQALDVLEALDEELHLPVEDEAFLENGERVAATEDLFELISATPAEVVTELARLPGAEVEHEEGSATVIGVYAAHVSGPRLEAEISISAGELLVGTLSVEGADRMRARLEQHLGGRIVHRDRVTEIGFREEGNG
jgi:SEC-C motif-containing protein